MAIEENDSIVWLKSNKELLRQRVQKDANGVVQVKFLVKVFIGYLLQKMLIFSCHISWRHFNSCVGFDSGCMRRQMDNFVHDLISANHDSDSENLTI